MTVEELQRWTIYRAKYDMFARVFNTIEGKKVLEEIMKMGFVDKPTFAPNNPEKTLINEGSRVLALAIVKLAQKDPVNLVKQSVNNNHE